MTDNEIKKALECCSNHDGSKGELCETECPYQNNCYDKEKGIDFLRDALNLINRLEAENERLKKEKDEYAYLYDKHINTAFSHIKAEAYKECIQKIKVKSKKEHLVCSGASLRTDYTITDKELNNLLKELVGDKE